MRFGILVPQTGPWPVLLERCLEVERLGYEGLWIGNHYFLKPMPQFELFEAMTVLGGIVVSVPRVRFGAITTNVIYRNPAVIAKQAATLDQMSGGRFELGLGAGVYESDHRMTGSAPWSSRERVDRFEEILATDFLNRNPDGALVDRAAFLAQIARPAAITNLEASDVRIQFVGDVAIIHARTSYTKPDGQPGAGWYTDTWAKRRGRWLAVAAHVSRG